MVVLVPLTPAIAVVGAGMTLPAFALRGRGAPSQ
jgi:hypothetical protein